MELHALYYDGKIARAWHAQVAREGDCLCVRYQDGEHRFAIGGLVVVALGNAPRRLDLPDGSMLEVADGAALDRLLGCNDRIARWETSKKLAVFAVPCIVAAAVVAVLWGLPLLADIGCHLVPVSAERQIAKQTIQLLDHGLMQPTTLPLRRQQQITARFQQLLSHIQHRYTFTLNFRNSEQIGPNAFALPAGQIVITDQLVKLTPNDDEVVAVLAHEAGHVEYRHGIRLLLRSSGLAVAAQLIAGDATSVSGMLASMPLAVFSLKYSREFETQADDFAIAALKDAHISPCTFPTMLGRLQAEVSKRKGDDAQMPEWLSSHPGTAERMDRYRSECRTDALPRHK